MFYFFFYFGTYSCVRRNKCQNKKDRSFDFEMKKDISTSGINCILSFIFPILLISVNRQGIAF